MRVEFGPPEKGEALYNIPRSLLLLLHAIAWHWHIDTPARCSDGECHYSLNRKVTSYLGTGKNSISGLVAWLRDLWPA
jgi:hypothetical protein